MQLRKDIPLIEKQKSRWKKRTPESLRLVLSNFHYLHETIKRKSKKSGLSDKYLGFPVKAAELRCILAQLQSEVPAISFEECPEFVNF